MVKIYGAKGSTITTYDYGLTEYDGTKSPHEFDEWRYYTSDVNRFIWSNYPKVSSYCTSLYHSSPLARAAVEKPLSYTIGNGLLFRSHIPSSILGLGDDEAREWSRVLTELIHLEKQASGYYRVQQELAREAKITGDALLFILYRDNGDIDFVPVGGYNINFTMGDMGMYLGSDLQPLGVYLMEQEEPVKFYSESGDLQLLHFKYAGRPKQLRGFSAYYSEISRCKNLDRAWDAILARLVQEAIILGQYVSANPMDLQASFEETKSRAKPKVKPSDAQEFTQHNYNLKPGAFMLGSPGDKIEFVKPETPSDNFGTMNDWTWNMFAASVGYPSEFLQGKYSTSFTAHKGALNDAWKRILQERTHFANEVEKKINGIFLKKFIREGEIRALGDISNRRVLEAHLQGAYVGASMGHIDPKKEVEAMKVAVAEAFTTRADAAQIYSGSNFHDMIGEWGKQEKQYFEFAEMAEGVESEPEPEDNEDDTVSTTR